MFSFGLLGGASAFDPLVLLLGAMGVDALFGGFRGLPHPEGGLRRFVAGLEAKLNRERRTPMDRAVRGFFVAFLVIALTIVASVGVAWLTRHHQYGWVLEGALIALLINQRGCNSRIRRVGIALAKGNLEAARDALRPMVARDAGQMDGHTVARVALEAGAVNLSAGVVAPVFWYVLFGFPGLALSRALSVMDSVIGHATPRYRAFGMSADRLDGIVQLIPARLAGLFLVLAALFSPQTRPGGALKVMLRDAGKYYSTNAGWPVAAVAGALNLALGGARQYAARTVKDPWVGDGTARAEPVHVRRGLYLLTVGCLLNAMLVAALAVVHYAHL